MPSNKKPININPPQAPNETDNEEFVNSFAVAKSVLSFLAKRGIPASPKNYRVFYDYMLYANPVLNKALNELLAEGAKFFSPLSNSFYERFYSYEMPGRLAGAISEGATDFLTLVSALELTLDYVKNQAGHYQLVLKGSAGQLAEAGNAERLQAILDELLAETEAALASNDYFLGQVTETGQAVATVKAEIKHQATQSRFDELTKLHNRGHLNREAPKLMARSQETNRPLSVVMFGLDSFKSIKDTWGRGFGDKVLAGCAKIIQKTARSTDLAVRLGDEDFLLMCLGLDLDGAARVYERISQTVAGTDINAGGGRPLMVTLKGGVAQHIPGEDLPSLLGRADKELCRKKNNGLNPARQARPN